jgi:hypothetical protein
MKSLHGFEIVAVYVGFPATYLVACAHSNITFHPVPGGKHDDSYVLARTAYLEALHTMLTLPKDALSR